MSNHKSQTPFTRREALQRVGNGFGMMAFAGMLGESLLEAGVESGETGLGVAKLDYPQRVKRVIFLFMNGGPSQVDTFDPKPRLDREHGQPIKMKVEPTQFNNVGTVLKSPWQFRRCGRSGIPVSDLFPHVGSCVDDLVVIRSMVSNF